MLIVKQLKTMARAMLMKQGSWVRLVFVGILWIFAALLPLILATNVTAVLFGEALETGEVGILADSVFWSLLILCALIVTVPTVTLLYRYAWQTYRRCRDGFGALETARDDRIVVNYGTGLLILLRPLCVIGLFGLAYGLAALWDFVLYLPLVFVAAALSVLFLWGTGFAFLLPYYLCRGQSCIEALRQSRRRMNRQNYSLYGSYLMLFLGWILLSLLTVGVLLILYTLPLMLFTYFALAEHMTASTQQQEETQL